MKEVSIGLYECEGEDPKPVGGGARLGKPDGGDVSDESQNGEKEVDR